MREQSGTGAPAADWQAGCWRLGDCLTASARQLRADVADDTERSGDVVEDLGDVLAQGAQHAATGQASAAHRVARCGVFDDIAWKSFRQRPACRLAILRYDLYCGRFIGRTSLSQQIVDVGERQFQLL